MQGDRGATVGSLQTLICSVRSKKPGGGPDRSGRYPRASRSPRRRGAVMAADQTTGAKRLSRIWQLDQRLTD